MSRVHFENHCWEFCEFADNILDQSVVIELLECICDERDYPKYGVFICARQSLDREGANREIVGYIKHADREFSFKCRNGNWNGTEITDFEETEPDTGGIHRLTSSWYD